MSRLPYGRGKRYGPNARIDTVEWLDERVRQGQNLGSSNSGDGTADVADDLYILSPLTSPHYGGAQGFYTPTNDILHIIYLGNLPGQMTLTSCRINVASYVSGAIVKCGLYSVSGTNLLLEAGSDTAFTLASTGRLTSTLGTAPTLAGGTIYALGILTTGAAVTLSSLANTSTIPVLEVMRKSGTTTSLPASLASTDLASYTTGGIPLAFYLTANGAALA